jgi:predicted NUDIX family NTP pyrophosphohydrolase
LSTSAGILFYRTRGSELELLLAHPGGPFWAKKEEGAWSIPKGEIEGGEEPVAGALRELAEELGPAAPRLAPETLIDLGSVRQKAGKVVHGWAAEADFDPEALDCESFSIEWPPRSGRQQEFPEVDRVAWYDADTARRKLIAAQAAFVDRLLDQLGGTAG